jgi:transcriptional regulator with XRE-family HTH domain
MELQLSGKLVRAEREKRAWSQEHLASVSGIGVRTVQRIEASGRASFETAKALASVFELSVEQLSDGAQVPSEVRDVPIRLSARFSRAFGALAACTVIATCALFAAQALAGQLLVKVTLTVDENHHEPMQLITDGGKPGEIRIDEQLRLVITPTEQAGRKVLLEVQIYDYASGEYRLAARPKLVTTDAGLAEIRVTTDSGRQLTIGIRPNLIG